MDGPFRGLFPETEWLALFSATYRISNPRLGLRRLALSRTLLAQQGGVATSRLAVAGSRTVSPRTWPAR
jgi:hypothetical protein